MLAGDRGVVPAVTSISGFSVIFYEIPRGNIAAYYPQANPLVAIESIGEGSFTPTFKSVPVMITPTRAPATSLAVNLSGHPIRPLPMAGVFSWLCPNYMLKG